MNEPIRLVLGFSAGSASDEIARIVAPALASALSTPVEIELRPGQNGAAAASAVATAAADGRTLFMATLGTHALAPHLQTDLPYDPLHHFAPVALVAAAPLVLACHPSLGVSGARGLIDLAKREPGKLTYGTSAIGGAPHLAAELFEAMAGVQLRHVRYSETTQLYADLETGRIAVSFNNVMSMLPRCTSGRLRALAVTTALRSPAAETIPTLAEDALPGYDMSNWLGIVAPRGTAPSRVAWLNEGIARALRDPAIRSAMLAGGVTPRGGSPDTFAEFMAAELARWAPVVSRFRDAAHA